MNGNGNGVSWKWVGLAATALVVSFGANWGSAINTRVTALENRIEPDVRDTATLKADVAYIKAWTERQDERAAEMLRRLERLERRDPGVLREPLLPRRRAETP